MVNKILKQKQVSGQFLILRLYTHYSNQDHVVISNRNNKTVKKKGPETDAHNAMNQ